MEKLLQAASKADRVLNELSKMMREIWKRNELPEDSSDKDMIAF